MADEIVKGSTGFTLVSQAKKWSKEKGWYVAKRYEGAQATHATYADTLINEGADDISISTGVPCVIDASFPLAPSGYNEDQKAQDEAIWELMGEPVEKRLETHGKFNYSGSSAEVIELINKDIVDGTASNTDWNTVYAGRGLFNEYRDLRLYGVDSYQSYAWRVRKTITVSRASLLKAVFANVGKVITWASIGIPASAKFDQPTIHMVVPESTGAWTDEAVNEWLVQPPQVRWRKGIKKWEIVQEYVGSVYISSTLYDGGTATP